MKIDKELYNNIFKDYPDVVTLEQMCTMLNIGEKKAYRLLRDNEICYRQVGREYRIPKLFILEYFHIHLKTSKPCDIMKGVNGKEDSGQEGGV